MKMSASLVLTLGMASLAAFSASGPAQIPGSSIKPTVYVSNFEIDAVPTRPAAPAAANPVPSSPNQGQGKPEQTPAGLAKQLVDQVSTNLVAALQQQGYPAERLGRGGDRPSTGVLIRGIFVEVDKENHWRRAVIRTGTDTGIVHVVVCVANLAKPEQAMYEIAHLPGNDNRPGAVITLSPYVPLEQYDIDKGASEDMIKKMAGHIVSDMKALFNANPSAIPQ